MTLAWILKATGGKALSTVKDTFNGLGTDTRQDLSGQLFIALKGDAFDAHQFLDKAVAAGAAAIMVHQEVPDLSEIRKKITVILVPETLKALQALGHQARVDSKAKIIGITGSNGKTTTKEFTAAVIGTVRDVHYSKGSFNNHWGVPFTLLQLEPQFEVAVVEMGMNHAGEITELVKIADPDIVMVTMVGQAHIEHFGSVDAIAAAKEEIYEASRADAVRIYNLDNPLTKAMWKKAQTRFPKAKILAFSNEDESADVYLKLAEVTMRDLAVEGRIAGESGNVRVPVFGSQNLTNLMAAAAAALAVGLDPEEIWQGLIRCRTVWGRNQFVQLGSGAEMIFDAYNANPDSMGALLDNVKLIKTNGRKIGVFGQMRELGTLSAQLHEALGKKIGGIGFDEVYFVGSDFKAVESGLKSSGFKGKLTLADDFRDELGQKLATGLSKNDIVLVKASRGMELERFVYPCQPLDFGSKK